MRSHGPDLVVRVSEDHVDIRTDEGEQASGIGRDEHRVRHAEQGDAMELSSRTPAAPAPSRRVLSMTHPWNHQVSNPAASRILLIVATACGTRS